MRINTVKTQLREGHPSIGTWLCLPDPLAAQIMAHAGFDWLNVDMEHYPISIETAALMFQAIAHAGRVPLVRIPWNTGENVKRVLDSGAWGVIFPMQMSAAEVEAAVASTKYPPYGTRSVGGMLAAVSFHTDSKSYFARANEEILVVIQIEHIRAVERADEILRVPGVDAVFIGPSDLTASMGLNPNTDSEHPKVQEAIEHIRITAAKHGVASGIHVFTTESMQRRIEEGFRFIALASDIRFMTGAAKGALAQLRR